jgi:hypothetical protein
MDKSQVENMVAGFVNWWKDSIGISQEGEAVRIVCPMLDRHNDHMSIYIAEDDGGMILSDIGATIDDLTISGYDVSSSEKRMAKLEQVLSCYGLEHEGNEIYKKADRSTLFQAMNFMMQGMAAVDDLHYLAKENVRNLFVEDLQEWITENDITNVANISIQGKSGFVSHFDFVIPKTKKAPERLLKAVSSPTKSSISNALFGFGDIKDARPDANCYIVANLVNSDGTINDQDESLKTACMNYGAYMIPWVGNADEYKEMLCA